MQYLEHILFGLAFLAFVVVAFVVLILVLATVVKRRNKPAASPSQAVIYPIPPAERGTGQHRSLLDLVDEHAVAEELRERREAIRNRVNGWVRPEPPKA